MAAELIVLRFVHIVGGTFWVGSAVFVSIFLFPALAEIGPAAGQLMAALQRRRMMVVMPLVAVLTVLSGARLMWITSGGDLGAYGATPTGRTLMWGATAAILALLIGLFVARPTGMRAGRLAGELAAAAPADKERLGRELQRAQRRAGVAGVAVVLLLLLAATGMAIARYL
jgi:uncharacterized membrane protein